MTLQIQEGKYYRTRDGRKVGPMGIFYGAGRVKFYDCEGGDREWSGKIWYPDGDNYQIPEIDLVTEWKDTEVNTEDTPVLWKDMTDEEKGALLLAHHEGETIEWSYGLPWKTAYDSTESEPVWDTYIYYRVKPAPKEPKRETVTIYGGNKNSSWGRQITEDTHKITFDLIDGVPDCGSIKMEKL